MEKAIDLHGKILVADDDKINVDFFQVMLTKLGFSVEVAYNGEEVLEKVTEFAPDLILLDLLMPKLSGFQVAEILKKDNKTKDIPIVVLSAVSDIKDKVDMLELGIDDYITKPFNFVEILARIRNILRSKSLKNEITKREGKFQSFSELESYLEIFLKKARVLSRELVDSSKKLKDKNISDEIPVVEMISTAKELSVGIKKLEEMYTKFVSEANKMENGRKK